MTIFLTSFILFLSLVTTTVSAHSGRLDSSGGHNCSDRSIAKGLCSGYHYHNVGISPESIPVATPVPAAAVSSRPTVTHTDKPSPVATIAASPTPTLNVSQNLKNMSLPEVKKVQYSGFWGWLLNLLGI